MPDERQLKPIADPLPKNHNYLFFISYKENKPDLYFKN